MFTGRKSPSQWRLPWEPCSQGSPDLMVASGVGGAQGRSGANPHQPLAAEDKRSAQSRALMPRQPMLWVMDHVAMKVLLVLDVFWGSHRKELKGDSTEFRKTIATLADRGRRRGADSSQDSMPLLEDVHGSC